MLNFYLYADPLRTESQTRTEVKFVIWIFFELSNTSWDALTFILVSGVSSVELKDVYYWFPQPEHEQFGSFSLIRAKLSKSLITTVAITTNCECTSRWKQAHDLLC